MHRHSLHKVDYVRNRAILGAGVDHWDNPLTECNYPIWGIKIELGNSVSLQFILWYTLKQYLVTIDTFSEKFA